MHVHAHTVNGSLLKAGFYSFQMAVDLNATEGHSVKCSRIAPLPATEQRLLWAKRPVRRWGRGCKGAEGGGREGIRVCSVSGNQRVVFSERQKERRHSGGAAR